MYEGELEKAKASIAAGGRDPAGYDFDMDYQPPDPDGAGMFTIAYDVTVRNRRTGKSRSLVGGIGHDWVARLETALADGTLD